MLTMTIFIHRKQGRTSIRLTNACFFATLFLCLAYPENLLPSCCCCGCRFSMAARWRPRYPCRCSKVDAMKQLCRRQCLTKTRVNIFSIMERCPPQRMSRHFLAAPAVSAIWLAPVTWLYRARNWSLCKLLQVGSSPIWLHSTPSLPPRSFLLRSSAPDAGRVRL